MAKVGSVAVAHAHRHHPPNDNMTTSTPRGPEHSVNSKPPSRRGSRISNRAPQIVIEPPSREDELYPSLTTLGSFQDDEDEFSCKDCCRSACSHFFDFTFASCMYITCQRKKPRGSSTNVDDMEITEMKNSLQFHFMNPFQKWRFARRRRFPWKLFVQLLNIILVTLQLIFFANTKLPLTHFVESNHKTFVNLFIENPAAPTTYEPIPSPISTLYTLDQLYSQINFTANRYYNLWYVALGPYGYDWINENYTAIPVLYLDVLKYANGMIEPGHKTAHFSEDHWKHYVISRNVSSTFWNESQLRDELDSIRRIRMRLNLSSIYVSEHTSPKCFLFHIEITIKNDITSGNMPVTLVVSTEQSSCLNNTNAVAFGNISIYSSIGLSILDIFVGVFATISTIMHLRSLVKSAHFAQIVRTFFQQKFNHKLKWKQILPLFNMWFVAVILSNCLATVGALLRLIIAFRPLPSIAVVDIASIIVGLAVFAQWCGVLRFLSYFDHYNMLLLTLRISLPSVLRFTVCAGILYFAFLLCGWLVLGAYHPKFRDPSTTSENLFALLNGDDIYNTYQEMSHMSKPAWIFSKVYLYVFISLFIYVVLSVFISLISDTYETLHEQWSVRSKGLLQDFAYGQLGRVREARTRAYSGGGDSTDEEENKDYDMIREIAESSRYGATHEGERQPLLSNGGPVLNFTGGLNSPSTHYARRSAEFTIGDRDETFQRQRSNSHTCT